MITKGPVFNIYIVFIFIDAVKVKSNIGEIHSLCLEYIGPPNAVKSSQKKRVACWLNSRVWCVQ